MQIIERKSRVREDIQHVKRKVLERICMRPEQIISLSTFLGKVRYGI
jgi:hypothetical protein